MRLIPDEYTPVPSLDLSRFRRLTNLELWSPPFRRSSSLLCPTVARQLLEPAHLLTHLLLKGVSTVDDQLLFSLWDAPEGNPMEALTNVVFDQCHEISVRVESDYVLYRYLPRHIPVLAFDHCSLLYSGSCSTTRTN